MSPEERFWSSVKIGDPSECWDWIGRGKRKNTDDYGSVTFGGKRWVASRLAFTLAFGEIPEGLKACHTCDRPCCCNPNHIFLGTDADNVHDAIAKGRFTGRHKTRVFFAKGVKKAISEGRDALALKLYSQGMSYKSIAHRLGVDNPCVIGNMIKRAKERLSRLAFVGSGNAADMLIALQHQKGVEVGGGE